MASKTLGTGGRARNGQYRRKSKFHPCATCGLGTTFIVCVKCQGRILASNMQKKGVKVVADIPGDVTEKEATEWLQMMLFD